METELELGWGSEGEIRRWRDIEGEREREFPEKEEESKNDCEMFSPLALGRAAPLPVSFDNDTQMPVAPELPPYTWSLQLPFCAKAYS